ncbi:MAG TPA: alpha/beta hydrolase [Lacibacter sp.]|nr:alpha/beta hydrolase [Lacibacter sp.]HMO87779.1 alpha/beta hydrolase [Lacibacter sp.]
MNRVVIFLFLLLALAGCKKKDQPAGNAAQVLLNVSYGSHARHRMDVHLPANRSETNTPVLIMIHGGGWTEGDKADFAPFVDTLKRRLPHYAIFNINYRLAGNGLHLFPAQEEDVKQCVDFIYSRREAYKISGRFAMAGASAGGHLALLHSYKYNTPVKIKAVVDFFGPTDLTAFYNNPPSFLVPLLLLNVTGTTPALSPSLYQQSSPLTFAVAGSPPTIILQGGADVVVPPSQSILLRDRLAAVGVPHEYVFYPAGGHGDWNAATYADAFSKIERFLKTHNP